MKPSSSKSSPSTPADPDSPRIWGLTGGIASGKSTVARYFEEAGIPVVDADRVAARLREPGAAGYEAILKRFGTADRARLREIVFRDLGARKDLEGILHPLIREASEVEIRRVAKPGLPVLYEAALLVETGRYLDFEGLIVVHAPREARVARVMERDSCTREAAEAVLNAQLSDEARSAAADIVVDNSGNLEELRIKVDKLVPSLRVAG